MGTLFETLSEANEVKPVAEINNQPVFSFEDAVKLTTADLMAVKAGEKKIDLGVRQVNPDGYTYARSKRNHVAIDPDRYFLNRYRKTKRNGKTIYEVVTDYRAINEKASGAVYTNVLVAYEVTQDKDELVLVPKQITDDEFIKGFNDSLDNESMAKILGITDKIQNAKVKADKLEF